MSTSKTYQQSLADAGSETRPPMFERVSYIPWASRLQRYINRKRENQKWLNKALDEGPYQFQIFILSDSTVPKLQTAEDLQGDALLHYDAEIEVMNLILLSIPNDIYNSVDACTSTKDMWKRFERLMRGTIQNKYDRETRFTNEFDQFVAKPGEALVSVYNRFAQLMNDLERNDMHFPIWKGHYARNCPKPRVWDSKYFMKQMLLAKQDEAGVILTDEQNDFLFADASSTIGDDQIDSNIIFDTPNENVNSGSVEKDTHPDLYALEQLARNAYQEADKQQIFAQKVQRQNKMLTSQLELYKERVRVLENINEDNNYLNEFLEANQRAKHFDQQAQS
nr:hypothetical protein [Tanacetum cinerariifolium]